MCDKGWLREWPVTGAPCWPPKTTTLSPVPNEHIGNFGNSTAAKLLAIAMALATLPLDDNHPISPQVLTSTPSFNATGKLLPESINVPSTSFFHDNHPIATLDDVIPPFVKPENRPEDPWDFVWYFCLFLVVVLFSYLLRKYGKKKDHKPLIADTPLVQML